MLNCLAAITSVTAEQDCCESKHVTLTRDIQHHLRELVDAEASQVVQRCGFTAHLRRDRSSFHTCVACLHVTTFHHASYLMCQASCLTCLRHVHRPLQTMGLLSVCPVYMVLHPCSNEGLLLYKCTLEQEVVNICAYLFLDAVWHRFKSITPT